MTGRFFVNHSFFYFVVQPVGWSDELYTVCSCDFKALNIATIQSMERKILESDQCREVEMCNVPRSFVAFCIARFPRSFE